MVSISLCPQSERQFHVAPRRLPVKGPSDVFPECEAGEVGDAGELALADRREIGMEVDEEVLSDRGVDVGAECEIVALVQAAHEDLEEREKNEDVVFEKGPSMIRPLRADFAPATDGRQSAVRETLLNGRNLDELVQEARNCSCHLLISPSNVSTTTLPLMSMPSFTACSSMTSA